MQHSEPAKQKAPWRGFNWWKVAFFFMLFVLECCREIIVVQLDQQATPDVHYSFSHEGASTEATGFWKRTDKKNTMDGVPVSIQCDERRATCILVYLKMEGLSVFKPDLLDLPAHFTNESITFVDHQEDCVEGPILIDLKKKIVRHWHEPKCGKSEPGKRRIDYILSDDSDPDFPKTDPVNDNFLPLFSILYGVVRLI